MNNLTNAKQMLALAKRNKFAIPHININNLEWIQATLSAAQIARSPIILGVSIGAAKYMGGYKIIVDMVKQTINNLEITVPVCLHLDHGDFDNSIEALNAGFSSIMFDGSKLSFQENFEKSKILIELCRDKNASIELEVGSIGGYEDGISNTGELANIDECIQIDSLNPDFLAAGIGNIHGIYPQDWKGLNFDLLKQISESVNAGIVLHGGSGIDDKQIQTAINLGIRKINVNTECQIAFSQAIQQYILDNPNLKTNNSYDPRKYLKLGKEAITKTCLKKMFLFGSTNQY